MNDMNERNLYHPKASRKPVYIALHSMTSDKVLKQHPTDADLKDEDVIIRTVVSTGVGTMQTYRQYYLDPRSTHMVCCVPLVCTFRQQTMEFAGTTCNKTA
jgi:hypothetical protein